MNEQEKWNISAEERLGRFTIEEDLIRSNPAQALGLMRDIIIIEAKWDWFTKKVQYLGISHLFDPLKDIECDIPHYRLSLSENGVKAENRAWPDFEDED